MPLTIEFGGPGVTVQEISDLQKDGHIHLRANASTLSSGSPGFFLGWACLPDYLFEAPTFPVELGVRYIYRDDLQDGGAAKQGKYMVPGIEHMNVQHKRDFQTNVLSSRVVIIGDDLRKISEVFEQLRDGALVPTKEWSSPDLIAAPRVASANDTKEDSGQLVLPLSAAPETKAA